MASVIVRTFWLPTPAPLSAETDSVPRELSLLLACGLFLLWSPSFSILFFFPPHTPFIYRLVTFSNRTESLRQFCECLAQCESNSNLRSLRLSIVALGLPFSKYPVVSDWVGVYWLPEKKRSLERILQFYAHSTINLHISRVSASRATSCRPLWLSLVGVALWRLLCLLLFAAFGTPSGGTSIIARDFGLSWGFSGGGDLLIACLAAGWTIDDAPDLW